MADEVVVVKKENWIDSTRQYLIDIRGEMKRVTWPSRVKVESTTVVVILSVFAFRALLQGYRYGRYSIPSSRAMTASPSQSENSDARTRTSFPKNPSSAHRGCCRGCRTWLLNQKQNRAGTESAKGGTSRRKPSPQWYIIHTYSGFEQQGSQNH